MRVFRIFTKLILLFLLVGIVTALFENSIPASVQEFWNECQESSVSSHQRDFGSIAIDCINLALDCCLPTPAFAGDLEGDVQGD